MVWLASIGHLLSVGAGPHCFRLCLVLQLALCKLGLTLCMEGLVGLGVQFGLIFGCTEVKFLQRAQRIFSRHICIYRVVSRSIKKSNRRKNI